VNRILLISSLIFGFILLGLALLDAKLLVLALPLLIYLCVGLLFAPQSLELQVVRTVDSESASADSPVTITVSILNQGPGLEEVLLEDLVPENLERLTGEASMITALESQDMVKLVYTVRGKRGIYQFSGLRATAYDRFGICQKQREFPALGTISILPEILRLKNVAIRPRQTRVYSGNIPTRQGGSGIEFLGVREYQPGDPVRLINWRASARHRDLLFINEFQQERLADVWLILDARQRSDVVVNNGSLFEHAVVATTTLAQALLNQGNRVGLLVYGGFLDWTYPGYGKIQRERILRALAHARLGESMIFEKLEYLPTRVFPLNSQLILISPLHNEDLSILLHLRARGYQVIAISPDPIAYETNDLLLQKAGELGLRVAQVERSLLVAQLRQAGVNVFNWDVTIPFDRAMHLPLSRLLPMFQSKVMRR
jgi:uncharacterized protein (DUF58 family)